MIFIIYSMSNFLTVDNCSGRNNRMNAIRNSLRQIPALKQQSQRIQLQILRNYQTNAKQADSSNQGETNSTSSRTDVIESTNLKFLAYNSFLEKYDLLDKLGQGGNACVYKCQHKENHRFYAVKKFRIEEEHVLELKKSFIHMKQLKHPSICHYKALYFDSNQRFAYLVMEYLPFPNLSQCTIESEAQLKIITKELITAMRYIHNHGICHRDLKPENILYDQKEGKIKIIDFGISKKTFLRGVRRDMLTIIGTHVYLAPQVYIGGGYDQRIDLWALGVTLYKLIAGYTPFESEYHSDTISNILKGEVAYDEKIWGKYSTFSKDFVNKLLKEKNQRMTLGQAEKHLWIQASQTEKPLKMNRMFSFSLELNQEFHQQMKNVELAMSREEGSNFSGNGFSKTIKLINVQQYDLQDSEEDDDIIFSEIYEYKRRKTI